MTLLNPPQSAPSWTHSPDDLIRITKEAIEQHRKIADEVASIKDADCTFENVRTKKTGLQWRILMSLSRSLYVH